MFAEVAPRYDFLNHLLSLELDHGWRRCLVRLALARQPSLARVLDLCTGTGDLALLFARRLEGRGRVVGLDFCPEMVERAVQKRRGAANVSFGIADATRSPLAADQFDVVSVAFGIRNVQNRAAALREILRVLRPQGALYVLEFALPRARVLRGVYRYYFTRILPRLGRLIARTRLDAYAYLPASVDKFPSPESFARELESAGFVGATHRALGLGAVALHQAFKPPRGETQP
jgi:demethylmenaquinone methyltransferase/2-methoxy-6-polyprenyl-1,4-benzoquinol methylase